MLRSYQILMRRWYKVLKKKCQNERIRFSSLVTGKLKLLCGHASQ